MLKRMGIFGLIATVAAFFAEPRAWAWGQDGHAIAARIAERHLTPRTKQILKTLLGGRTLADVASWADDWREFHTATASWHFVNMPLSAETFDVNRDCVGGNCVIAALTAQVDTLGSATAADADRQRALRFVVHFVADLHQPLHAADNNDRGGNQVKARLVLPDPDFPYQSGENSSLHALWDADLIDSAHRDQDLYVAQIQKLPEPVKKMQAGTFVDWAVEAHLIARDFAYKLLPAPDASGSIHLGADYAEQCRPKVELQLQRAGVRLARVLNEAFTPKIAPPK